MNEKDSNIIISKLEKYLANKSKRLHDPIFFGNEVRYLNKCIETVLFLM